MTAGSPHRAGNAADTEQGTEDTWRDACATDPTFAVSESPTYVARGVAALAADPDVARHGGQVLTSRQLADTYGVTVPTARARDCWGLIADGALGGDEDDIAPYR